MIRYGLLLSSSSVVCPILECCLVSNANNSSPEHAAFLQADWIPILNDYTHEYQSHSARWYVGDGASTSSLMTGSQNRMSILSICKVAPDILNIVHWQYLSFLHHDGK